MATHALAAPMRLGGHLLLLATLLLAGCGMLGDDDASSPDPAAGSGAAGGASSAATPDPAEEEWARKVCEVDVSTRRAAQQNSGVDTSVNPTTLSLAQRTQRAATLFPAVVQANEDALARLNAITPPPSAVRVQATMKSTYEAEIRELKRTIAELERLGQSAAALDANNTRIANVRNDLLGAVQREFERPSARRLEATFFSLNECRMSSWNRPVN